METTDVKLQLIESYFRQFPGEAANLLNNFSVEEVLYYLNTQPLDLAGELLLRLRSDTAVEVLEAMGNDLFSKLFPTIDIYLATIMISRLKKGSIKQKLNLLPEKIRKEITELMSYPPNSAGFVMDSRIITFHPSDTVQEVLKKLRSLTDQRLVNIYIVDDLGKLLGRSSLEIVAISEPHETLKNLMEPTFSIHVMSPMEEAVDLQKQNKMLNLPVVDLDNRLLGLIRNDALVKAARQDATEDIQALFGAGREERALSKVSFAIRKRLPWLEINLATAFLAASVVGLFEETIARITVLAVFLPVVAGQSGNTGSQALAVTMRGLALREIRIGQWLKVARKEVAVGFFNGIAVSLTTAIIVYFWADSLGLAAVIGVSMVFSMVIAGFSGAVIPILLKSIGQDPAQSSSIILTTVTDIVGFMSFLGLATILGSYLGVT
ncbi:MAG: magnesium transporter MgtE [Cyclobacteriaceae bacterium]|nr:MAG: magnesium transporter MgtE [Cyclobacteriaceae bacterium]